MHAGSSESTAPRRAAGFAVYCHAVRDLRRIHAAAYTVERRWTVSAPRPRWPCDFHSLGRCAARPAPGTQYDESTIDLQPGDVILFASDGILESANATDEEFGLQRLSALLSAISPEDSARAIADRILEETDNHSGVDSTPHDDRTLVVLRVTDETASDFSKLPIIY